MSQPGSVQHTINDLNAQLDAVRKSKLELQIAYDRQAAKLRQAIGIIRDCYRATGPAAEFLERVK